MVGHRVLAALLCFLLFEHSFCRPITKFDDLLTRLKSRLWMGQYMETVQLAESIDQAAEQIGEEAQRYVDERFKNVVISVKDGG
ncbi:unnamed protein product, partial [Mesorhabditis belari]|uniref:Uncharacterized protein n=1 Tax=Mesorhabditis belari TaxID=2138241 RepID=A0AAF3FMN8_9BILA